MVAFVLGNGESRKSFDCSKLLDIGPVIGCNAIYRDMTPHYVVCVGDDIKAEILSEPREFEVVYRHRKEAYHHSEVWSKFHTDIKVLKELQPHSGECSGAIAVRYICTYLKSLEVYILGFDSLFCQDETHHNNVYANTPCYRNDGRSQVYENYLPHYAEIMKDFPKTHFFIVADNPSTLKLLSSNQIYISYEEFKLRLGKVNI